MVAVLEEEKADWLSSDMEMKERFCDDVLCDL